MSEHEKRPDFEMQFQRAEQRYNYTRRLVFAMLLSTFFIGVISIGLNVAQRLKDNGTEGTLIGNYPANLIVPENSDGAAIGSKEDFLAKYKLVSSDDVEAMYGKRVTSLEEKIAAFEGTPSDPSSTKILLRISENERSLSAIKDELHGLRQAINPINPEEVLTIARIVDSIEALRKDNNALRDSFSKELKAYTNYTDARLAGATKALDDTNNLLWGGLWFLFGTALFFFFGSDIKNLLVRSKDKNAEKG